MNADLHSRFLERKPVRAPAGSAPEFAEAAAIFVEIATPERFSSLDREWCDLAERAAVANVFMDPATVGCAALASDDPVHVVLAWKAPPAAFDEGILLGAWALRSARPSSGLPVRVLKAPVHPHAALGTPVIDAAFVGPVLDRMLAALRSADLPKLLEINALHRSGPIGEAFDAVLGSGNMRCVFIDPRKRPGLDCRVPDAHLSRSRAKALRRNRRRLAEHGAIDLTIASAPAEVGEALDRFLDLEAAGWKGRREARGRAMLRDPRLAGFFRQTVMQLAAKGRASIATLCVSGRPVAMQVVATSGRTAFTWKTCYDETLRSTAPGLMLLQDLTAALRGDPALDEADSCNHRDDGYMAEFWGGRIELADVVLDVCPGSNPGFRLLALAEDAAFRVKKAGRGLVRKLRARTAPRAAPADPAKARSDGASPDAVSGPNAEPAEPESGSWNR